MTFLLQAHVVLSLAELCVGVALLAALCRGRASSGATSAFLALSALTSLTGFPLPPPGFDPARAIGLISLGLTALAAYAFYVAATGAAWRTTFVVAAVATLYLDAFVALVQAFQKLTSLQSLAPTQSEPPFVIAQAVCLLAFLVIGAFAIVSMRRAPALAG